MAANRASTREHQAAKGRVLLAAPPFATPAMRMAMAVFAGGSVLRWNIIAVYLEVNSLNEPCNLAAIGRQVGASEVKVLRDVRLFKATLRKACAMAACDPKGLFAFPEDELEDNGEDDG